MKNNYQEESSRSSEWNLQVMKVGELGSFVLGLGFRLNEKALGVKVWWEDDNDTDMFGFLQENFC